MVITRQQNATAEANTSVTKFSKEQNDLKMEELKEYSANNVAGQYDLNLHVLGLNNYSTFAEMMTMINTDKYELQDRLREND